MNIHFPSVFWVVMVNIMFTFRSPDYSETEVWLILTNWIIHRILIQCTSQTQCFVKLKMPIYDVNVSHTTSWHNTDQACTNDTVSVCGAAVAVFPVDGEALALETTAPGTGLSLMICLLLTLPHHIAVILPQSLNCSRRKQRGWYLLFHA